MKKDEKKNPTKKASSKLSVEELEKRIAPALWDKKSPIPPPYPAGADYGLIRRDNLRW